MRLFGQAGGADRHCISHRGQGAISGRPRCRRDWQWRFRLALADCQDERSFPLNAVASMLLMVVNPDKSQVTAASSRRVSIVPDSSVAFKWFSPGRHLRGLRRSRRCPPQARRSARPHRPRLCSYCSRHRHRFRRYRVDRYGVGHRPGGVGRWL